uniref:CHK kinase-like domain-containing protein n=1 Tax=Mucochytrium quahogii TaxID=96639 RepID=A0A7S2R9R9_9STRA|mmetsp:Transcript_12268/g.19946  ORF Transcript_12268/g.19946 Transcript_12268/m.19946 type:complete len:1114 (+) Transcript_12268:155-3496(+)|eukprot:CAMPEP_0203760906 /NCGR_PEP_ID=MMETSP0098-20131031/14091_1 /ASSEMBLY_ACC=CAM_ASM_000208 /TAXON_ID=96639 /ORGANISM=" , Strain NY0313808BC1" /LENGTH=1113 /DNA_ID=CAMNT_0050654661 /DNA_START=151 /DNA_END=3492 /DNA_ORIENTATION=+
MANPVREDDEVRADPRQDGVRCMWLNAPNVIVPDFVPRVLDGALVADVPLAVVCWRLVGSKFMASTVLMRAISNILGRYSDRGGCSRGGWMFMSTSLFTTVNLLHVRLTSGNKGIKRLTQWLVAFLGVAQLGTWSLANPKTLLGVVFRGCWLFVLGVYCLIAKKLGLGGSFLLRKVDFPASPGEVSKDWVEKCLQTAGTDTTGLTSISVSPLSCAPGSGSSRELAQGFIGETARITVEYDEESHEKESRVRSLVGKFPTRNMLQRFKMRNVGVYFRETMFYSSVAHKLREWNDGLLGTQLKVPRTFAVNFDDGRSDFVILMEDCAPFVSGDERVGATWQQACSVAARYARFHSIHWSNSLSELEQNHKLNWVGCFDWLELHPMIVQQVFENGLGDLMSQERFSRLLSPEVQRTLKLFSKNIPAVLDHFKCGPMTFVHADARMENMLFPKELDSYAQDEVCHGGLVYDDIYDRRGVNWSVVDWQTCCKGVGIQDLAYFIAMDLTVAADAGTKCDEILVEYYYRELGKCLRLRGVEDLSLSYSFEQCWEDYKLAMLIAIIVPIAVMTEDSLGCANQDRAQAVRESMLSRCVKSLERLDVAAILNRVLEGTFESRSMGGALSNYTLMEDRLLRAEQDDIAIVLKGATPDDELLGHFNDSSIHDLPKGTNVQPGSGRRDAYDRWFLNGYDIHGKYFFAAALGVYPGRRVVDASFSCVIDGIQHNIRASRKLSEEEWPQYDYENDKSRCSPPSFIAESQVGPISISVLKPLESVRLTVTLPGEILVDLVFEARYSPQMEPHYDQTKPHIGEFNYDRLTQLIKWKGSITIAKQTIQVCDWWGTRDRSWGRRPHPVADHSRPSNLRRNAIVASAQCRKVLNCLMKKWSPQFYWIWCPINLEFGAITYHSQQDVEGKVENGAAHIFGDPFNGSVSYPDTRTVQIPTSREGAFQEVEVVGSEKNDETFEGSFLSATKETQYSLFGKVEAGGHSLRYFPGTRHAKDVTIILALPDGRRVTLSCEPLFPFFMSGVGYNHPTWGHGIDHGADLCIHVDHLHTEMVDRNDPLYWHIQEVCRITATVHSKEAAPDDPPIATSYGIGCIEQLIVGPHQPSGFTSLYDV